MSITLNGTTGITTPAIDNQGNLTVDGGTIKLDGNYPVGANNVALGDAAGDALTTGGNLNTFVGSNAGSAVTTGGGNTAIGAYAFDVGTGSYNTGLGSGSLGGSSNTASSNTGIGYDALNSTTTGYNNTAIGANAARNNTTAAYNIAMGYEALFDNTTGQFNTALGSLSLANNTTASNNTAVGCLALTSNTTGSENAGLSDAALQLNTTGNYNSAAGRGALNVNTTGSSNSAFGMLALSSNTTATNSTAVGYQAGYSLTTNGAFVGIGYKAGFSTTGILNTFLGYAAGQDVTTGTKNTIIGAYNGNQGGLDIRTASNNIVLSDGDGNPRVRVASNGFTAIGPHAGEIDTQHATLTLRHQGRMMRFEQTYFSDADAIQFTYNGTTQVGSIQTNQSSTSYNTSSDYRLKENVVDLTGATDRLKQLNPSRFNFIVDSDKTVDGFLAHEVQAVVPEAITGTKDAVDADGNPVYQGIDQSKLVPLLVATIQELEARITALEGN
jgi:hypothetical protein